MRTVAGIRTARRIPVQVSSSVRLVGPYCAATTSVRSRFVESVIFGQHAAADVSSADTAPAVMIAPHNLGSLFAHSDSLPLHRFGEVRDLPLSV